MKINLTVPVEIADDLMKSREMYSIFQREYVKLYKMFYEKNNLGKTWAIDTLDNEFSLLEFQWQELIEFDGQMRACAEMLNIDTYAFLQVVRIYRNLYGEDFMDYLDNLTIENILNALGDEVDYNGKCYAPEEIKIFLRNEEWDKVK